MFTSIEEKFLYFIGTPDNNGCIPWNGPLTRGYGQICLDGKSIYAHRYAYERVHGPIPSGLFACHHCDNPKCVNCEHLFLGTHAENTQDCVNKGRNSKKLTSEQVLEIRAIAVKGNFSTVARMFYVTPSNISDIVNRKLWKHI